MTTGSRQGIGVLETFWRDARYAVRIWSQSPAFTLFVVGGLALAIGLNTAVFTIVNAALFRNLPFQDSDRISYLSSFDRAHDDEPMQVFSYADYKDFETRLRSFEQLAAVQYTAVNLSDDASFPEHCRAVRMTANMLSTLGQRTLLGRDLTPADTMPGAPRVVLMTYRLWARRYGKDPSVIGKTLRIDEKPVMVIGITAPGVRLAGDNDLFLPLVNPQPEARGERELGVLGRLAPGVSVGQASAEAGAVARQLGAEYPDTNKDLGAVVQNVSEYHIHPRIRQVLKAMLGGVSFVLLIACANAANLLLGRAMIRSREISIRSSLGAGRADVIRQLLTESVLLSITAGVLGSLLAYAGVKAFDAALGQMEEFGKPDWVVFSVDRNVLLYSLAISIGTGIVFGLAPALRMSRGELVGALREGGHGSTEGVRRRWLSAVLVAGEVALSVVLLLGAGLLVRSMVNTAKADLGVNTANVLSMRISLPDFKYKKPAEQVAFFQQLRTRLEALPGVQAVAVADQLPGNGGIREDTSTFQTEDDPISDPNRRPRAGVEVVGPGYFQTMQAALLQGREFTDLDGDTGHEAAIVNQSFAAKQSPAGNLLGKRILVDDHGAAVWSTVVGVAADIMETDSSRGLPRIYLPYRQAPDATMYVAARMLVPPMNLATSFRQSVRELDENLPVFALRTLAEHVTMSRGDSRLFASAFAVLAGIALVLASMGLYAVISQSVSQRTREFGIRFAMGATRPQLLWLVYSRGMWQFTIGLAIGVILSLALGRVLSAQLVGISSVDPVTYLFVIPALTIAAALACGLPARRVARSDPAEVLRLE